MILPLFIAASVVVQSDTIPDDIVLLGRAVGEPEQPAASSGPIGVALDGGVDAAEPLLLGDPIGVATFTFDGPSTTSAPEAPPAESRLDFTEFASLPMPDDGIPGLPMHPLPPPADVGFTARELDRAVELLVDEVRRGAFPGAALAVGRWSQTVLERGIGTHDRLAGSPAVDPDHTIYDLASLTKVIATTSAVMLLVEDGRMDLDAPVRRYLPAFTGGDKDRVTIRHLLTHTSGLPAGGDISAHSPEASLFRAISMPLARRPGQRVAYSDIGFIVLWAAAQAASDVPLPDLLRTRVYEPLDMRFTSFLPGETCRRCAPTLDRPGYQGVVHDPLARQLGGVTGHAGLFSTAHDLARFAAMLANGGELDGVRVFRKSTIERFTRRQPGADTRALGWDTPDEFGRGAAGLRMSPTAFGHTGFTGTSLWVDPARGTWVVLLSNRTLRPSGPNRMQELRREVHDSVASAVDR